MSVVCLWSQFHPLSAKVAQQLGANPKVRLLCIDHPEIRNQVIHSSKVRVNELPCLLVATDKGLAQYEGQNALQFLQARAAQNQQNIQNTQVHQGPLGPQGPHYPPPPGFGGGTSQGVQSNEGPLDSNGDIKFQIIPRTPTSDDGPQGPPGYGAQGPPSRPSTHIGIVQDSTPPIGQPSIMGQTPMLGQGEQTQNISQGSNGMRFQMTGNPPVQPQNPMNLQSPMNLQNPMNSQSSVSSPQSSPAIIAPPSDVTPISQVVPEPPIEVSQPVHNPQTMAAQAAQYYQQYAQGPVQGSSQGPAQGSLQGSYSSQYNGSQKPMSPKEMAFQQVLAAAQAANQERR